MRKENKHLNNINILVVAIPLFLIFAGFVYFAGKSFFVEEELEYTKQEARLRIGRTSNTGPLNIQMLGFAGLFVDKVLKSEGEVDIDTRIELEEAIRNLGDKEVLNQWQEFVASKTDEQAQAEAKNLLETLINKAKDNNSSNPDK